jgi:hypothetical protein
MEKTISPVMEEERDNPSQSDAIGENLRASSR